MQALRDFSWDSAPLSDYRWPVAASATYVACVTVYALACKPESPAKRVSGESSFLVRIQQYHNLFLCLWSLAMFAATAWFAVQRTVFEEQGDWFWFVCEREETAAKGPLFFCSYVYYLSKYYELVDTLIACLRGRPPPSFKMHAYHHAVVIFMCWNWLEYTQSLQFPGLLFNTFVHVIMYFYYYKKSVGEKVWWKNWVTRVQIVQFLTSFALAMPWAWAVFVEGKGCAGTPSVLFNCVFNLTLLVLFLGVLSGNKASQAVQEGGLNKGNKQS